MSKSQTATNLLVHPAADIFPMMSEEELVDLAEDIKANGLAHPLIIDAAGQLIDGRNRHAACLLAGVKPRFESLNGHDPLAYIASANLKRRNLSKGQQAMVLAMIYPEPEPGGRGKNVAARKTQETLGFSGERLRQARQVLAFSRPLAETVIKGSSLDEAVAKMKASLSSLSSEEVKKQRLRAEAPDLADAVAEGHIKLDDGIAALDKRIVDDRNAKRSATRGVNSLLAYLEPGEASPQEAASKWVQDIDFSIEPYPLPITRLRLERALEMAQAVLGHLIEEVEESE